MRRDEQGGCRLQARVPSYHLAERHSADRVEDHGDLGIVAIVLKTAKSLPKGVVANQVEHEVVESLDNVHHLTVPCFLVELANEAVYVVLHDVLLAAQRLVREPMRQEPSHAFMVVIIATDDGRMMVG